MPRKGHTAEDLTKNYRPGPFFHILNELIGLTQSHRTFKFRRNKLIPINYLEVFFNLSSKPFNGALSGLIAKDESQFEMQFGMSFCL